MRVLAVCSESALHVSSKETAKKGRNLAADGRCVITTDAGAYQTGETKGRGRPPRSVAEKLGSGKVNLAVNKVRTAFSIDSRCWIWAEG